MSDQIITVDVPTIRANHNGWIFIVGAAGWASLDVSDKPHRRNIEYPDMLLRKRFGLWGDVGTCRIWPQVSVTLEAAYQQLLAQERKGDES